MVQEIVSDRSRILAGNRCLRQRFFEYHCLNTGIRQKKLNLPTSVGTLVHSGRALILEGKDLEEVITQVLSEFDIAFKSKEIDLDLTEDQLFVYEEQRAMVEGMVRIWYYVMFPKLKSEFEVVKVYQTSSYDKEGFLIPASVKEAIEPEINWILSEEELLDGEVLHPRITFMSRPDAILRNKSTGGIVVDSFKTTSYNTIISYNDEGEQVDKNKYDDQGISELIAVERLLGESVESVRMEFFVKGARKKSTYTLSDGSKEQRKLQQSFIVHPWKKDNGIGGVEYACKWEWKDEYGNSKRLGKGWNRVDIWKEMTVKEWVELLIQDNYGDLENLFLTPYPYVRSTEDVENWIEQNSYKELTIARHLEELKSVEPTLCGPRESESGKVYNRWLNHFFPQDRSNCFQYGGFCSFVDICWSGEKTTSSLYEKREPHHEKELQLFQIEKA